MPYRDIPHRLMSVISEKFAEKPEDVKTKFFVYGGWKQSVRKFVEDAKNIVDRRDAELGLISACKESGEGV